jgi:acetyl esterase/lipase
MDLSDASIMRKGMEIMEKLVNGDLPPLPKEEEFYHEIPMRDGFSSALKILKPAAGSPPGPLIVLCFGGGFVGGTMNQFSKTARALRTLFGATVVSISYRLAPEYKFVSKLMSKRETQTTWSPRRILY